jgi:hypothetical protein
MDLCLDQYEEDANYKEFSHLQAEPSSPQCSTNDLRQQVHILAEPLTKYILSMKCFIHSGLLVQLYIQFDVCMQNSSDGRIEKKKGI